MVTLSNIYITDGIWRREGPQLSCRYVEFLDTDSRKLESKFDCLSALQVNCPRQAYTRFINSLRTFSNYNSAVYLIRSSDSSDGSRVRV